MSEHRIQQVNELIKKELGYLLLTEVEFPPGCLGTIAAVETSKDLGYAKIWMSIYPADVSESVLKILNGQAKHLKSILFKKITLKPFPKFRFYLDTTEQEADKIDRLLDKIKEED